MTANTYVLLFAALALLSSCSDKSGANGKLNEKNDTTSFVVSGHEFKIVKNTSGKDSLTLYIGGKKAQLAGYFESHGKIPDSLKRGDSSLGIMNGKRVTIYSSSSCTRRRDSINK